MSVREAARAVKTILVIGVVGILVVVVGYESISGHNPERDQKPTVDEDVFEDVTVSVTSSPPNRPRNPALILVYAEGVKLDAYTMTQSPYSKIFRIPRGAHLDVDVEQSRDGILDCIIQVRGKTADHNTTRDAGILKCRYPKVRR